VTAPSLAPLAGKTFAPERQHYGVRDTQLYALGLGIGHDPCDAFQLAYLRADSPEVVPTQAAVLAASSAWMRDPANGIDWARLVALSHRIELDRELPPQGSVESRLQVTEVQDRGAGRGAIICWTRELFGEDGRRLAQVRGRALARGNGGFGGAAPARESIASPEGEPESSVTWPTHPAQALLYALSGDRNPLHLEPEVARAAGFPQPILHGLCSLGICTVVVARAMAQQQDSRRISAISGRYAGVAYPGESLRVDLWKPRQDEWRFRCTAVERQAPVIEDGVASFAALTNPH
jgi:acyl dehydratase